ncbi:FxLYD domain-containing protein [Halorarum salinum]|uniref:FxLYD domain-containing protein n=1 Tax=Halorarum salinum TaxID=2743089 RepID=UPI001C529252|nr:FxLYD domain-containing protein [Halobaculum salinum]
MVDRDRGDGDGSGASGRSRRATRRGVLVSLGAGATAALAGCTGASDDPTYEEGEVGTAGGDPRNASEMSAAAALAPSGTNGAASSLDALSLEGHEFVVQSGYKGATVRGTVANVSERTVSYVEVRVRAYDADGAMLGRYLATAGDLAGGTEWGFEVLVLTSPADVATYDVAVLGVPE